jgi:hypothetical protein
MAMSRKRDWCRVAVLGTVGVLCAASGFSAQSLPTAVDPTCAVIEKAEYDASRNSIRITGRSSEATTLRVYDADSQYTLVTAKRSEPGKWSVEFDLVGADTTPGMVVVQGISGCVASRTVTDQPLGQGLQTGDGFTVAAVGSFSATPR